MGAEPATHEDTTQDSISRHLRESGRKQEALKEALDGLDTDCPEDRNAILADNELLGELGLFSDESVNHLADRSRPRLDFRDIPGREWSDERQRTMQVQTRMNAMNAHLNTRSTLAELRLLRGRLKKIEMMLAIVMALVVAMALSTLWKN